MHLYNAWLPPPVAEQTKREAESFASVVSSVKALYRRDDPDSVYATIKWISVIDLFIKAKSEVSLEDVGAVVELGLELFNISQNKLYVQVRWGNMLVRLLNKYRKKLSLKVPWRPLYDTLIHTHFTRSRLENPWHNSSFEGSGFVRLFLPTNLDNKDFFSNDWIKECLELWDSIPNCQFWNSQWTAVIARVIKNYEFIDWECYIPTLFSRYLNMFEVPVANGSGSYPFSVDVPRNTRFLFSNRTITPSKAIAKSVVYLLRPGSSAQKHFEKLVDLLEQYYHPSNGGRWTYSLERFLLHLVVTFQKRLQCQQQNTHHARNSELYLGSSERTSFVNVVLKLIDRGQYSKNEHLSETVAAATSILSYVDPSSVLPFLASRFRMALETAFAGRSLFLTSLSTSTVKSVDLDGGDDLYVELLMISLSNALAGMDANDPPKTLATMQLIGSIFSNIAALDDNSDELSMPMVCFSEWLDEFLCRLFSLLQHLEPSSVLNEGLNSSATSGTFLVEEGPYYYCMLEILLGRLSKSLYNQALKKISKFVRTNILPGAIAEVGLLCCACVQTNPEEAVVHLVEPVLLSAISSLEGTPVTGFGGRGITDASVSTKVFCLQNLHFLPALETAIDYQLKILSVAISYAGPALLRYKDQLKEAIVSAFDSPSWKVNVAGDHLLRSLLGSLILYYPIDQYRCVLRHPAASALEEWISTKDYSDNALDDLLKLCQTKIHSDPGNYIFIPLEAVFLTWTGADSGSEKEHLKVTLLRIESTLQGVLSCLPDFRPSSLSGMMKDPGHTPFLIAGATGSTCRQYLLKEKSDDSILLILIIRIMDALGNYGSLEFDEWSNHRQAWKLESAAIIEPPINFIVSSHSKGKRRPRWALVDKAYMHGTWRSSQSSYHLFRTTGDFSPSDHVVLLMDDLLNLSLHSYETVRLLAGKSLLKMIKRWPSLISKCVLSLTENLRSPSSPEYTVLGSCAVLSTQTVLKHLTTGSKGILFVSTWDSFKVPLLTYIWHSHHESLKAQKAINELFVKYNIHFAGVSKSILKTMGQS
ncbi:hypothetical protein Patl1_03711 [Pistacia atlantica]|uniref:Uncharacterized protein n=1 Tax=Pistacia atlantica TaxID=434234 RepID=A0ACC1BT99_9ROSI|nr:hypothetical protein Patl1_03711 [Pistacia atlantica]